MVKKGYLQFCLNLMLDYLYNFEPFLLYGVLAFLSQTPTQTQMQNGFAELKIDDKRKKERKHLASPPEDTCHHHQAVEKTLIPRFLFKMYCSKLFLESLVNRL